MVALAAARARALAAGSLLSIEVTVSPGVFKNARAVGLPGSRLKGLDAAAALGAVAGRPDLGLGVLRDVRPADEKAAVTLLSGGKVTVTVEPGRPSVFARVILRTTRHTAEVVIEESHANVTRLALDGEEAAAQTLRSEDAEAVGGPSAAEHVPLQHLADIPFREVYRAAVSVRLEDTLYLIEGAERNLELAAKALAGGCREAAPDLTQALHRAAGGSPSARRCDTAATARLWCAAAVSARMGGTQWPVLTSGGSGNQGILVSVPVLLAARERETAGTPEPATAGAGSGPAEADADRYPLARALVLAHAVNLYFKAFTGKVSALCGSVTGAAGVAAAVCHLAGGSPEEVESAVQLAAGGLFAMVCDGAKGSCALKIGEGAAVGVTAGRLARLGGFIPVGEGIIGRTVEETARTLGLLTREVLNPADRFMLRMPAG
jgi:L-cysteine desulfidase